MSIAPYLEPVPRIVLPPSDVYSHDALVDAVFEAPAQLISGIVIAGLANSWSGDIGIGKTWLELAAARAIASGQPFLGHFATTQSPVLIIDQESHKAKLAERVQALNRADPMPRGIELNIAFPTASVFVNEPAGYAEIDRLLREYQPALAFFDSLTRFHNANENDAGQMADVNASFKQLMQDHKCGITTLDHSRKPSLIDKGGAARHRLRGSNEKAAFVDAALVVEREGDDGELIVRCSKARWVTEFPDFRVKLEVDGDRIWLRFLGEAARDAANKPHAIVEAILHLQANHGPDFATKTAIAGYLEASETTVWRHLKALIEAGLVRERRRDAASSVGRGRKMNVFEVITDGNR